MIEHSVLIAGGASRRMGTDKCLLEWLGRPLWQHQLATLESLGTSRLAVAAPVRPTWLPARIEWLPDVLAGCGPLGGVLAAMESAAAGHVLVLAVDLPQMTADFLQKIMARCGPGIGVVPRCSKGYEPLAAVYPAEASAFARSWFEAGHRDLHGLIDLLIQKNRVLVSDVDDSQRCYFLNLNSPADLNQ